MLDSDFQESFEQTGAVWAEIFFQCFANLVIGAISSAICFVAIVIGGTALIIANLFSILWGGHLVWGGKGENEWCHRSISHWPRVYGYRVNFWFFLAGTFLLKYQGLSYPIGIFLSTISLIVVIRSFIFLKSKETAS